MATRISELTTEANPPENSLLAVVVNGITRKTFLSNVLGLVTGGTVTSISGGTNVSVTSSIASSPVFVTGLASNDTITAVGHRFVENQLIVFSNLVGGSPLVNGVAYGAVNVTSDTFKLLTIAGDPINITTNLTSGSVLPAEPTKNITVSFSLPGMVVPYAGLESKIPSGWLICNGRSVSTTTYQNLYNVIGYQYGGSGGSFNLPDLRGRMVFGSAPNSGASSPLNGAAFSSGNFFTAASTGGFENHLLTAAQSPVKSHTHSGSGSMVVYGGCNDTACWDDKDCGPPECYSDYGILGEVAGPTGSRGSASSTGTSSALSGVNAVFGHNNIPPAVVMLYLIKT